VLGATCPGEELRKDARESRRWKEKETGDYAADVLEGREEMIADQNPQSQRRHEAPVTITLTEQGKVVHQKKENCVTPSDTPNKE